MNKNLLPLTLSPLLFAASCTAEAPVTAEQPNILFIFTDDWGYGDLGCYGNTEVMTPNIDKLAAEGTRFTQFHVASGVSSPSRTAVITGQYPARHRVHGHFAPNVQNEKRGMPNWLQLEGNTFMPQLMKDAGYTTAHIGKWHLGGGGEPNGDLNAPVPTEYGYDMSRVWNGNGPTWNGDQKWETTRYMDSDTLWCQTSNRIAVDETLAFLKENKDGGKPMFVNLWIKDPHTPLHPTDEQKEPYQQYDVDKETYYAVLTDADFHIGRLLDELKAMGLEENTLVLFSSDNGPAGYKPALSAGSTGGLRGRKTNLFQGGVNVPFIMRWPGKIEAGAVNSCSVLAAVDLLPTFVELGGGTLPEGYEPDGESFASFFGTNKFKRTKPIYWDWRFSSPKSSDDTKWVAGAVRDGEWKLVADKNKARVELYNIANDPNETTDLAADNAEVVKDLLAKLTTWQETLPASK